MFACTRKDRLTARNGTPYLAVELRDRTGAIPGRAFRDADFLAGQFERGDLVSVAGRVERFRDQLQVDLRAIRTAEADPSEFLPVAYRNVEELDGFLEHLAGEVYDPDLVGAARRLPGRRGLPRRAAPGALHPRRAPRLPGRAARAHGGGGHAGPGDVRAASAPQLGRAAVRGDPPRRGQDAGVRCWEPRSSSARPAPCSGHLTLGQQLVAERAARLGDFPETEAERDLPLPPRPPRRRGPSGTAFPLRGGACAVPPERP